MKENNPRPINEQYLQEEGKFIQMLLNSHTLGSFNFDNNLRAFIQDSQGEDYMSEIDSYLHENRYSVHDFASSSEQEKQELPQDKNNSQLVRQDMRQNEILLQKDNKQSALGQKEQEKTKFIRKINKKKRKQNEKKRKMQKMRSARKARQENKKLLEVSSLFAANKREQYQWAGWTENLRQAVNQIESMKDILISKNPFDLASDYEVEVEVEKKRICKDFYSDYDDDPYELNPRSEESSEIYQLLKDKSDQRKSIEDKFHSSADKLFDSPGMLKIQIDRISNIEQYDKSQQVEIVMRRDQKKERKKRVCMKKKRKLE